MNYNHMIKIIALVVLTLICITTWVTGAKAGGPWNDQYCDVEITKVKVVDAQGTVIDNHTEEKVVCSIDGAVRGFVLSAHADEPRASKK